MGEYFHCKILIKYSSSMVPLHRDNSTELAVSVMHPRKVFLTCPRASRRCHYECVKADSRVRSSILQSILQCPHWQIVVRRGEDLAANICSNCVIADSISVKSAPKQREKCRWQCSSIAMDLSLEKEGINRLFLDDSDLCLLPDKVMMVFFKTYSFGI